MDWSHKKIGLVLSGGGAKGAYQAGMFRALEELGLAGNITVMSGCSIGAGDAAFYEAGGWEAVRRYLASLGSYFRSAEGRPASVIDAARADVERGAVSLSAFINESRFYQFDTEGFSALMASELPDGALAAFRRRIYVCAYCLERERPEYFLLNNLAPQVQRDLILASGSLPFVFPPVEYAGAHYLDGGVIPPICRNGAPADKIPLLPVLDEDVDAILVNFLIASDSVDSGGLRPGVDYLELRPSRPLEAYPGAGTLDFSPDKLRENEHLGYRDTLSLFRGEYA